MDQNLTHNNESTARFKRERITRISFFFFSITYFSVPRYTPFNLLSIYPLGLVWANWNALKFLLNYVSLLFVFPPNGPVRLSAVNSSIHDIVRTLVVLPCAFRSVRRSGGRPTRSSAKSAWR